jgi:AbrB family looped-hinge helix DNA binding protein
MSVSTITSKGQTTIPKDIRNYLQVGAGDKIDFVINKNGQVVVEPAIRDVKELKGILSRPGVRAVSVNEMKAAVRSRFKNK